MSDGVFEDAKFEDRVCADCNRRMVRVVRGEEGCVVTGIVGWAM